MQQFTFEQMIDDTLCITGYQGDETEVVVPDEIGGVPVSMLGDDVFKGHPEITSVRLPDAVVFLGGFVFDGCVDLHRITLPAQLRDIFQYTFVRCGIEEIVLPEQIKSIPPFAFKDCKLLRRVVCNPGLQKIYANAFLGCEALTDVQHSAETEVSEHAFGTRPVKGGTEDVLFGSK